MTGATPAVLQVHNHYQQPGGEDSVVRAEARLLRSRGHRVRAYRVHNDTVTHMSRARLVAATLWNTDTTQRLGQELEDEALGVAHFHNTFPLVSPSAYYAARAHGVAVVQTLHNYRLLCPGATFFRDGHLCERCLGTAVPWPAVVHGCYRGSRAATAVVAGMLTLHRAVGTYARLVDVYIALTEFARRKFIEGGLPAEKIVVKPNFADDPGTGSHDDNAVLFVGRVSREKGIEDLLCAWPLVVMRVPGARLRIIGDGPLESLKAQRQAGIEWLGWRAHDDVMRAMQASAALVFPSVQREGFPMTVVEAFSAGLPVVTTRFEAMADLVTDRETGRLYRHGDPADLADVLVEVLQDSAARRRLGSAARAEYEAKYTPARNYAQLMDVYAHARERRAAS